MPLGKVSSTNLKIIDQELQKQNPNLVEIGKITKEGRWNYWINGLLRRSQPRFLELVQTMNQTFASIEQKGVKVFDPKIQDSAYLEKMARYQEKRNIPLDIVSQIEKQLSSYKSISSELKKSFHELKCRAIGLRYNLGKERGGFDPLKGHDPELLKIVKAKAEEWKKKQEQAIDKNLNALDIQQLEELAKYPEWLKIALENPDYLKEVFKWSLCDCNNVDILIKCFETKKTLKNIHSSSSIGYVRNLALTKPEDELIAFREVSTKTANITRKILTCAIYHGKSFASFDPALQERVNILDPNNKILFKNGNYRLTVQEMFQEMGQKNAREVNFNLCADWGIINFHATKGVWDADKKTHIMPEMNENDWTDFIAPGRIASQAELEAQYGNKMTNRDFFFKVMVTRQSFDLCALNCHSFWQIYIKMNNGNWRVLNIGFYAERFQDGLLDGLWMFCATLNRVMSQMDQSACLTHRHRAGYPVFTDSTEKKNFLNMIHKLRSSNGVFQFAAHNCARPIQKNTLKIIPSLPNFFHIPLTKGTTKFLPLDKVLGWADRQWDWVKWAVVTIVHNLFLSKRSLPVLTDKGIKSYSVSKSLQKRHCIYNPAFLAHQIEEARKKKQGEFVDGELYWSHTDEKIYQLKQTPSQPPAIIPIKT